MSKKRLRWRREPKRPRNTRILTERGYDLWYGCALVGWVEALPMGQRKWHIGYWWGATGPGVPDRNTFCGPHYETMDAAKQACRAYVEKHLVRD